MIYNPINFEDNISEINLKDLFYTDYDYLPYLVDANN